MDRITQEAHARQRYLEYFLSLIRHCPFPIREIQTDNGTEFTKALISNDLNDKSLFESRLEEYPAPPQKISILSLDSSLPPLLFTYA